MEEEKMKTTHFAAESRNTESSNAVVMRETLPMEEVEADEAADEATAPF